MDMSKLPRLSQRPAASESSTQASSPPDPPAAPVAPRAEPPGAEYAQRETLSSGLAEAWISVAVGAILLMFCPRILHFVFAHGTFDGIYSFTDASGAPMAYTRSVFFWGDLAMLAFAIVLLVDGAAILLSRRPVVLKAALAFTIVATLGNLAYLIGMILAGYGPQIISALAVAFGVYIAISQWKMLVWARWMAQQFPAGSAHG